MMVREMVMEAMKKNNEFIDMIMYERKHCRRMSYILTDIHNLYAKPIGS